MEIIKQINLDMDRMNVSAKVSAVQNDGNTRKIVAKLRSGDKPWKVPAGVEVYVTYITPSKKRGIFDKLADGSPAVEVNSSVVTLTLSIVFNDVQLNQLSVFPFRLFVEKNPVDGAKPSEDYIRLQWLEDKLDEYLKKAKESGEFDGRNGERGDAYFAALAVDDDGHLHLLGAENTGGLNFVLNEETGNLEVVYG